MTRVLVVDDEPQIRRALSTNLKARGYEVDLAPTGEDALRLAAEHRPDVVILDLGLPGIDGIEVVEGLRGWSTVITTTQVIDLAARRVTRDGEEVRLTPTEWHLVEMLVRHPGKLVSQRQLLQEVWGPEYERETNYLRVYMARVRRKLEADPSTPRHFLTEPGMGYRFEP